MECYNAIIYNRIVSFNLENSIFRKKGIRDREIPGMLFHFVFNYTNSKLTTMYENGTSQTEETKTMVEHCITHLDEVVTN